MLQASQQRRKGRRAHTCISSLSLFHRVSEWFKGQTWWSSGHHHNDAEGLGIDLGQALVIAVYFVCLMQKKTKKKRKKRKRKSVMAQKPKEQKLPALSVTERVELGVFGGRFLKV